ncbi:MAG: OadG family protein [Oscillospiraceae bacterium]|jgi:Na+-transporting methylmalonyl-CoA/oxaloacetate decarboxylase gamma subunit|nr:OadG family protein [Oscillospiraceae bacterium]
MLYFYAAAKVEDTYSNADVLLYALLGIAVVMSILALLFGLITLISKTVATPAGNRSAVPLPPQGEALPAPATAPQGVALVETESQGKLTLVDTDAATAAILMAIVSERSGIPLNHLEFKSIRLLGESLGEKEVGA